MSVLSTTRDFFVPGARRRRYPFDERMGEGDMPLLADYLGPRVPAPEGETDYLGPAGAQKRAPQPADPFNRRNEETTTGRASGADVEGDDFEYHRGPATARYQQALGETSPTPVPEQSRPGVLGNIFGVLSEIFLKRNIPRAMNEYKNRQRAQDYEAKEERRRNQLGVLQQAAQQELSEYDRTTQGKVRSAQYDADLARADYYKKPRKTLLTSGVDDQGMVQGVFEGDQGEPEVKPLFKAGAKPDTSVTPYEDWRKLHPDADPIDFVRAGAAARAEGKRPDEMSPRELTMYRNSLLSQTKALDFDPESEEGKAVKQELAEVDAEIATHRKGAEGKPKKGDVKKYKGRDYTFDGTKWVLNGQ